MIKSRIEIFEGLHIGAEKTDLLEEKGECPDEVGPNEEVVADLSGDKWVQRYLKLRKRMQEFIEECVLAKDEDEAQRTSILLQMINQALTLRVWDITGQSPLDQKCTHLRGLQIVKKAEDRCPLEATLH